MPAAYAMGVIEETHHAWQKLVLDQKKDEQQDSAVTSNSKTKDLWYPTLSNEEISSKIINIHLTESVTK